MNELEKKLNDLIGKYGTIYNLSDVIKTINKEGKRALNLEDIESLFENAKVFYYYESSIDENDYKTIYSKSNETPKFKLIKLCNKNDIFSKEMYLSFMAVKTSESIIWKGCLFGSANILFKKSQKSKTEMERNFDGYADLSFYNFLYENLLTDENWINCNAEGIERYNRLFHYLTKLCTIISKIYDNEKTICIESTKDGINYILFNSRLLDKYGNNIYLIHKVIKNFNENSGQYDTNFVKPIYVSNTECLIQYGFDPNKLKEVREIKLYDDTSEMIFQGSLDNIDLDDTHHLKHIIEERRDRLPESLKDKSSLLIYMNLKMSVEYALKMQKLDFKYIIPIYSITNHEIQFIIPFFEELGKSKPTCAIVVSKLENRWILRTILPIEIAYNNARLLAIPDNKWLV